MSRLKLGSGCCAVGCVSHTLIYLWQPAIIISKLTATNRFSKRLWLRWITWALHVSKSKRGAGVFISLYPVPILDFWGPYRKKLGGGGVLRNGWNAFVRVSLPSRIVLAEGARETVSLRGTLSTFFSQTRDCTTFTLQDFYIESVTEHRIKINDHSFFHTVGQILKLN